MVTQTDIDLEEANLLSLKQKAREICIPRKTISYQFSNMRYGNRRQVQKKAVSRRDRRALAGQIVGSQSKIETLKKALSLDAFEV